MPKKILPFNINTITSYNINASLCAIARDEKDSEEWLANNFIQIHYEREYDCFHYMGTHLLQYSCPFIQHEELGRDMIHLCWNGDVVSSFISLISMDKYLYTFVDLCYLNIPDIYSISIPGAYHEILIYGFDSDSRVFYCANSLSTGIFGTFLVPFENLQKAYWALPDTEWHPHIELLSYRPLGDDYLSINPHQIHDSIEDYLSSRYPSVFAFKRSFISGMDALVYEMNRIEDQSKLDHRGYHLFYEHKLLMIKRIETLAKMNLIDNHNEHLQSFRNLCDRYYQLRNLVIKFNMTENIKLLPRIRALLLDAISAEKAAMESMLKDLIVT